MVTSTKTHTEKTTVKKNEAFWTVDQLMADKTTPRGQKIMLLAEALVPRIREVLADYRDENGMLFQMPRIRSLALNTAQLAMQEYETETVH